jgi:hypothetical protein
MAIYDYAGYVDTYSDLSSLWTKISSDTESPEYLKWHPRGATTKKAFGKLHFESIGEGAGRKLPDLDSYPTSLPTKPVYKRSKPGAVIDEVSYGQAAVAGSPLLGVAPDIAAPAQRTPGVEELVEWRMSRMMRQQNPYTQQAITNAKKYANQAGMLNTSVAATAGVDAAIRSSLPIAQQDAAMLHGQALTNQRVVNEFIMEDYKTKATFQLTEFAAETNTYNSGLQRAHEKNQNSIERSWKQDQNKLDRELTTYTNEFNKEKEKIGRMTACVDNAMGRWSATVAAIESKKEDMSTESYNQSVTTAAKTRDAEIRSCQRR